MYQLFRVQQHFFITKNAERCNAEAVLLLTDTVSWWKRDFDLSQRSCQRSCQKSHHLCNVIMLMKGMLNRQWPPLGQSTKARTGNRWNIMVHITNSIGLHCSVPKTVALRYLFQFYFIDLLPEALLSHLLEVASCTGKHYLKQKFILIKTCSSA